MLTTKRPHQKDADHIHSVHGAQGSYNNQAIRRAQNTSGHSSIQKTHEPDFIDSCLEFLIRHGGIPGMIKECTSFVCSSVKRCIAFLKGLFRAPLPPLVSDLTHKQAILEAYKKIGSKDVASLVTRCREAFPTNMLEALKLAEAIIERLDQGLDI